MIFSPAPATAASGREAGSNEGLEPIAYGGFAGWLRETGLNACSGAS